MGVVKFHMKQNHTLPVMAKHLADNICINIRKMIITNGTPLSIDRNYDKPGAIIDSSRQINFYYCNIQTTYNLSEILFKISCYYIHLRPLSHITISTFHFSLSVFGKNCGHVVVNLTGYRYYRLL